MSDPFIPLYVSFFFSIFTFHFLNSQTTPVCVRDFPSGCRGTPRVLEQAPSSWSFPTYAKIVALADTDNDGDMDMVACVDSEVSDSPPSLSYYENMAGAAAAPVWVARMEWSLLGTALRCEEQRLQRNNNPSIVLTDSRNTGLLDIVIGSPFVNLTLFQNVGNATNPAWNFDTTTTSMSKEQRDDGEGTHVEVWLESIHSIARSLVPVEGTYTFPQVNLVDMDGDGDSDLVISGSQTTKQNGYYTYSINIFKNIRPTHSGEHPSYSFTGIAIKEASMFGYYSISFADVDRDSDVDILLYGIDPSSGFTMLENTGSRFEAAWTKDTNVAEQLGFRDSERPIGRGDKPFQIFLADIDSDKSVDMCYYAEPDLFVCFKRSSAFDVDHFVRRPTKISGWSMETAVTVWDDPSTYYARVMTADLSGHGRQDVIFVWGIGRAKSTSGATASGNGQVFQNLGSALPGRDTVAFTETAGTLLEIKDINGVELSPDAKERLFTRTRESLKSVFLDVTNDGHLDLVVLVVEESRSGSVRTIESCDLQVYARTSPLPNSSGSSSVEKFVFSRSPSFDIDLNADGKFIELLDYEDYILVLPQAGQKNISRVSSVGKKSTQELIQELEQRVKDAEIAAYEADKHGTDNAKDLNNKYQELQDELEALENAGGDDSDTGENKAQYVPDLYLLGAWDGDLLSVYNLLDGDLRRTQKLDNPFEIDRFEYPNGKKRHGHFKGITFGDVTNDGFDDAVLGFEDGTLLFFEQVTPAMFANGSIVPGFLPEWRWVQDWSVPKIEIDVNKVQGKDAKEAGNGLILARPILSDYDGDGDLDLLVTSLMSQLMLFEANVCAADCTSRGNCDVLTTYAPECSCFGTGVTDKSRCNSCQAGAFFTESDSINHAGSCSECGTGRHGQLVHTRANETTTCRVCPAGYKQNKLVRGNCEACATGQYQDSNTGSVACLPCLPGKHDRADRTVCAECAVARYQDEAAQSGCKLCALGRAPNATGSTACLACLAGKFQEKNTNDETICTDCGIGQYTDGSNAKQCKDCDRGEYQEQAGKTACLPCLPGKYGRPDSSDRSDCDECKVGTASAEPGRKEPCEASGAGTIVLGGGTTAVKVPEGSYLTKCGADACTDFAACPAGWSSGKQLEPLRSCKTCEAGKTSSAASIDCKDCTKGTFGIIAASGAGLCDSCLPGFFQPEETSATSCKSCPAGWNQASKGESSCIDQGGLKPDACDDDS